MTARALSVRPPWSWAISDLDKRIENRPRKYSYTGELFLHASSTVDVENFDYFLSLLTREETGPVPNRLLLVPRGAIVAVVDLVGCQRPFFSCGEPVCISGPPGTRGAEWRRSQKRWAQCPRHWLILDNVRKLPKPVPCKGMLGIWTVPADVEAKVREQLHEICRPGCPHA